MQRRDSICPGAKTEGQNIFTKKYICDIKTGKIRVISLHIKIRQNQLLGLSRVLQEAEKRDPTILGLSAFSSPELFL
jgi:hypothetical protein